MAKFEVDVDTKLSPERVRAAMLDFTDRRPDIWPGLAREMYKVYSVGETEAEVQEGSTKPVKVWARERYDWSDPQTITWTVLESSFSNPGSHVSMTVTPGAAAGSHVHILWDRTGSNWKGKMMVAMMKRMGPKIIGPYMKKTLDGLAAQSA
jgi:polyketide cyclase/dehydrase/lipid transport protein